MGTAIKHPVLDRVKSSLTSGHSDDQPWVSECLIVRVPGCQKLQMTT